MSFKIEPGIPIPPASCEAGRSIYPFVDMYVGDSFLVPCERARSKLTFDCVKRASRRWRGRHPEYEFAIRRVKGGVRIWRTV